MKHLNLKRIWAVVVMTIMMLQLLPIIATAEMTDEEAKTNESFAGMVRSAEAKSTETTGEAKIKLPEGVPFVRMRDLNEFGQVMKTLEKLNKDAKRSGESLEDYERFSNSRVLLKGEPDFSGFKPLAVILDPYGVFVIQFEAEEEANRFIEKQHLNPDVLWAEQDAVIYYDEMNPEVLSDNPDTDMEADEEHNDAHLGNESTKYVQAEELVKYIYENGLDNEVTVAVLDTGCELTHDFLRDRLVPNPPEGTVCDFTREFDNDPSDESGHGTHVAGIIVECTGDEYRALNVRIMPVRVLDAFHNNISGIANGIRYAADNGADVINMSLTVDTEFGSIEDAVKYAVDKGSVVCAASGNDGHNNWNKEPSNSTYPGVITVGALKQEDADWTICWYSNFGESVDIAAPGDGIYSSILNNIFGYKSGTSMATPHVAAAAAMIRQIRRKALPAENP